MKSIGWIGVGIMGKPMVRNLQKAGYTLHIYARNREKVADVIQEGAIFHDTIGDCAQGRDAVITMVGFPKDVEEVYFAPGNILDRADPGTYLIDMTTTSPALAQRIFQQGRQRGLRVLDAPVTGGDIGARAGTLSIVVGGEAADYQACRPLLAAMGTNLSHQGPAGCGQHGYRQYGARRAKKQFVSFHKCTDFLLEILFLFSSAFYGADEHALDEIFLHEGIHGDDGQN